MGLTIQTSASLLSNFLIQQSKYTGKSLTIFNSVKGKNCTFDPVVIYKSDQY